MVSRPIGIIVNPQSGKDVRRIVSHASTVTNYEKVNILQRVLAGIQSAGGRWVVYMPDAKDLVGNAFRLIANTGKLNVNPLNMPFHGNAKDTLLATARMVKMGVGVIITLGGDGTNRLVAQQSDSTPLIPISTGTNNNFPESIEGTKVGMAAGIFLLSIEREIDKEALYVQSKMIKIESDAWCENALIDLAISNSEHIGRKALWNLDSLRHIFVTRAGPGAIGPSGVVGSVMEIGQNDPLGAYLKLGRKKFVNAVLAAGSVGKVGIESIEKINLNLKKTINMNQGSVWADGDKVKVMKGESITVSVTKDGPLLLNVSEVLSLAAQKGLFYFSKE